MRQRTDSTIWRVFHGIKSSAMRTAVTLGMRS